MLHTINIYEAKTHFSKWVDATMLGEEFIIAKAGKPVAKLVPITPLKVKRQAGFLKGKLKVADDFDAPLPEEILADFEGR